MRSTVLVAVALLAGEAAVRAADLPSPTTGNESLQRALYGAPREATVEQVLASPADYEGRAVVLRGPFARGRSRDDFQIGTAPQTLRVEPSPAIAVRVRARAAGWNGQEVEVMGVLLRDRRDEVDARRYVLRFWQYRAPSVPPRQPLDAPPMSLEDLVYSGGKADGRTVKVVGQFRGSNLHGDLPPVSHQNESDWVIKDAFYAVWITGHGPDGEGFQLDPQALEDQENWVEVMGRPDTKDGITYLKAQRVALTDVPQGTAARTTPARNALASIPPAVVFTLPVNGEERASADVRLVVQFNKSMDEGSFAGRVR
ncbi:MAG TPA: hypothetical protein VFQ51_15205, partial [Vicinamibacteria bacterium]|nr:hypothetical protein [Vicinamibacteria bacterium]